MSKYRRGRMGRRVKNERRNKGGGRREGQTEDRGRKVQGREE